MQRLAIMARWALHSYLTAYLGVEVEEVLDDVVEGGAVGRGNVQGVEHWKYQSNVLRGACFPLAVPTLLGTTPRLSRPCSGSHLGWGARVFPCPLGSPPVNNIFTEGET